MHIIVRSGTAVSRFSHTTSFAHRRSWVWRSATKIFAICNSAMDCDGGCFLLVLQYVLFVLTIASLRTQPLGPLPQADSIKSVVHGRLRGFLPSYCTPCAHMLILVQLCSNRSLVPVNACWYRRTLFDRFCCKGDVRGHILDQYHSGQRV